MCFFFRSLHSSKHAVKLLCKRSNILIYIQKDATLHSLFYLETVLHVSGGTSTIIRSTKTVSTASGICHTVIATCRCCRTGLSVLWVAYATHSTLVSPNVISILLGSDGLGLVSYLLVIYYQNVKSYVSGVLIVLSNRIGDVSLLIVIAWIVSFGSWIFIYYFEFLSGSVETEIISFLVVLAAMTMAYATHSTFKPVPTLPRQRQVAITV
jgi:hypothetical protein